MVRFGSNNGYKKKKKDMCLKEIGLCAQNMIIILGSLIYISRGRGRGYMTNLSDLRIFTLTINKIFI